MSIQFGDILKHNNLVYPIVDISDVKGGLRSIVTFGTASLASEYTSIPEKYKTGYSLLLETSTGTIYYLSGTDATIPSNWTSVGISGAGYGIPSTIPKWTTSSTLGNSNITDNGDTIIISGNLQVIGTTSTINTENLLVKDPIILLAASQSGTPMLDSGLFINRGTSATQAFIWDESETEFKFISTTSAATTSGNVSIGTYSNVRTGALKVESILIADGSQGPGKILISDVNGLAGWTSSNYNPSGYITASALVPYLTTASASTPFYNKGGSTYSFDTTTSIYRTGSLSIGTGSVNSNDRFVVSSSGGTVSLIVDEFGNVYNRGNGGISTNTAFGLSALSKTTGYNNTAIGINTLLSNTTGVLNTAIGSDSLKFNIGGSRNTALGYESLYSNTTGSYNSTIGDGVLYWNTTGSYNIGLGEDAGRLNMNLTAATNSNNSIFIGYNTKPQSANETNQIVIGHGATGSGTNTINLGNDSITKTYLKGSVYIGIRGGGTVSLVVDEFGNVYNRGNGGIVTNTAFGASALSVNTTGYQNTAIGVSSLLSNTTGHANTALGYLSLSNNTTGNRNTALGNYSLVSNTAGVDNVALGYLSLQNNTTGFDNVALGNSSLQRNRTGDYNIAIGNSSLFKNTGGNDNIALGFQSLYNNTSGVYLAFSWSGGTGYQDGYYENVTLVYATGSNNFSTAPIVDISIYFGEVSYVNTISRGTGFSDTTTVFTIGSYGTYSVGSGFEIGVIGLNSGDNNIALGNSSLYNNISGVYNIALGNYSLYNNTSGVYNIGIGNSSLYNNTIGNSNIALGYTSLYNNTSGAGNVALGYSSLSQNTTGEYNFTLGYNSLASNKIGSNNIAIGYRSLYSSTQSSNNLAIGYNSLYYNTSGSNNIALGGSSLYNNTTGVYNNALGYSSLSKNTTGTNNNSFGYQTLSENTSGVYNIAVGDRTMQYNTINERNVAIGNDVLRYSRSDWNTAIGGAALSSVTTAVLSLSATFSPGNGYSPGTYSNVALWYQSGTYWQSPNYTLSEFATATIVVGTGGSVSSVTLKQRGVLFSDNTTRFGVQTGTYSYLLGTASGSGFSIGISSVGTSQYNTALGYGALYQLKIGGSNIGIGLFSGWNDSIGNKLEVANTSIFIGQSTLALANNGENEIVIGHSAVGNGSNTITLGNDSVIKTYLKGKVQLPTTPTNSGTYSGTYSTYSILTRNDSTGEVEKIRPNVDETSPTILTINLAYLTSTYPTAATGFKIFQHRPGFPTLIYEKTPSIWIQYQANEVF